MLEVAISLIAGIRAFIEDLAPALAVFAVVFSAGIYAKGLMTASYAVRAF